MTTKQDPVEVTGHDYGTYSFSWVFLIRLHCICGWRSGPHLRWDSSQRQLIDHLRENGEYV